MDENFERQAIEFIEEAHKHGCATNESLSQFYSRITLVYALLSISKQINMLER